MFLLVIAMYFIPTIVASYQKSPQFSSVFVVNFFLGWTIVGWVVALAWALKKEPKPVQVFVAGVYCSRCGKTLPISSQFCTYCGSHV
jgi:hypothetical protein